MINRRMYPLYNFRAIRRIYTFLVLLAFSDFFFSSCKTAVPLLETHRIYANTIIDSSIKADSQYVAQIAPYKQRLTSIMKQPVTYAKEDFTKDGYSSNEGNLLADITLGYSKEYAVKNNLPSPDFALLNIGGIRTIIPKGIVTIENVFEVMPFENELVFVQLDGEQMKAFFDYLGKEKKGHPLSGIKIIYKKDLSYTAEIAGKPFDENKKYWIATNDYLLIGGDRMYFFTHASNSYLPHVKLRDMMIEQMKKYKVLPDSKEDRLIFEN